MWEPKSPKLWMVPSFCFPVFCCCFVFYFEELGREKKQWTCIEYFQCTKNFLFWLFCTNSGGKRWFPYFAKREAGTHTEELLLLKVMQLVHGRGWVCPKWIGLASRPVCCSLSLSSLPPHPPPFSLLCCLFQSRQHELLAAFIPGNAKVIISHLWRGHFSAAREFHDWADITIQCPMA